MDLTYRPMKPDDIEFCFDVLNQHSVVGPMLNEDMPQTWLELMKNQELWAAILEDKDASIRSSRVGFGMRAFASGNFSDQFKYGRHPYVGNQLIEWTKQKRNPIFTVAAIQKANRPTSNGLCLFITHYSFLPQRDDQKDWAIRNALFDPLTIGHRGYNIAEVLIECYGDRDRAYMQSAGLTIKNDYSDYYRSHETPSAERRPCLMGTTRSEAQRTVSRVAPLFQYTPPRFFFSEEQQYLLRSALEYATNAQIVELAKLNQDKVKYLWLKIYDIVEEVSPEFFNRQVQENKRGSEMRRHLLRYLQRHREELLPTKHFGSGDEVETLRAR